MGKSPSPRKGLIKKADIAFSFYVRERDRRCVLCGSRDRLTNGHLITRSKYSTRWDIRNGFCQCVGCNMRHEYDFTPYVEWWTKRFGDHEYHQLVADSNRIRKYTDEDLKEIATFYQNLERSPIWSRGMWTLRDDQRPLALRRH